MRNSWLLTRREAMRRAISVTVVLMIWTALQPVVESMGDPAEPVDYCYLKVPSSTFKNTLTSMLSHVTNALSIAEHSSLNINNDVGLSNAIQDCVDLLELSSLQLSWALSSVQTAGKSNRTKELGSDLNTWLSAVSTNQETCKEGLKGTTSIASHLSKVSSLAWRALEMVQMPSDHQEKTSPLDFPTWVSKDDKKLLKHHSTSPDVVVALDGTGNFTRIMDAVAVAPDHSDDRFVIYIKKGVYHENVLISKKKCNVVMYGDGIDATVVTGSRSVLDGWKTFNTATFAVMGKGFIARDMSFENTAGSERNQAVAFRSNSDFSALYRCGFRGYQDTLYAHSCRQFYRECTITGTVDFIFGDATAVFQDCLILAKLGLPQQKSTVTAQGRRHSVSTTGFSIHHCNVSGDADFYLGRPWKKYSRTVVMESYISDRASKRGWLEWKGNKNLNTLYYGEYNNFGPGADVGERVNWTGYHVLRSPRQAKMFTVSRFIRGDSWLPGTGVAYDQGL